MFGSKRSATSSPRANSRGFRTMVAVLCGAALLALIPQFNSINEGADPSDSRAHRVLILQPDEEGKVGAFTLEDERLLAEKIAEMKQHEQLRGNKDYPERKAMEVYANVAAEVSRLLAKRRASMQQRPNTNETVAIAEYDDETDIATFPACHELRVKVCEKLIAKGLKELGMGTRFKMEKRQKRKKNAEGYNKVVIVTDLLADLVAKDPDYPYKWNGLEGNRDIGPWTCVGLAPDECCGLIKDDVQDADAVKTTADGDPLYIECEIQVPVGGQGNSDPDRVIIKESADGRVHEIPTSG